MSTSLNLEWTFGFNKDIYNGVHSISTSDRNAMVYASSYSCVIYDYESRTQIILQGHRNTISCCQVTSDKRWIITADAGDDPVLIVWDSLTGIPVKTIYNSHANGIIAMDVYTNNDLIVTIGFNEYNNKYLSIWQWTLEDEMLVHTEQILYDDQSLVCFDSGNKSNLASWGDQTITFWEWNNDSFENYTSDIHKVSGSHQIGCFTSTVFLNGNGNTVTTTSEGYVILWEQQTNVKGNITTKYKRKATKIIRLVECRINIAKTTNENYLVLGCADGSIKFYDFTLRIDAWFEDLSAGPIMSLSFNLQQSPSILSSFWSPDFLVGTSDSFIIGVESSCFHEVTSDKRRGTLLLQGVTETAGQIACHPHRPLLAICTGNGKIQLWNYEMKLLLNLRDFSNSIRSHKVDKSSSKSTDIKTFSSLPLCLNFQPYGKLLAIGFQSGTVKLLDCETLVDITTFAPSGQPITTLIFSISGDSFACLDTDNHIILFKKLPLGGYEYIGRVRAHFDTVTSITYGKKNNVEILLSIGADRKCVEYDVISSSVETGVQFADQTQPNSVLDISSRPTASMWHPKQESDVEDRFIVAFESYKFKEYNADSKQCRKTTLSPSYGDVINRLLPIYRDDKCDYYAFASSDGVIGVGRFPLTGNPTQHIGIISHPIELIEIALSGDGNYLFSSGGSDLSINMWKIDVIQSEEPLIDDVNDYLELLEGGRNGNEHNEITDFFYYCQIRSTGEDVMEAREITGTIPVEEISNIMRALGYFPSENEIDTIVNEVRYKNFLTTGVLENEIDLNDFIKLYINYRPIKKIDVDDIENALNVILNRKGNTSEFNWSTIKRELTTFGEAIPAFDYEMYLNSIVNQSNNNNNELKQKFVSPNDLAVSLTTQSDFRQ